MSLLAASVFAAILLGGAMLPGAAAASATLPPEGIFENCNLEKQMATCLQRLDVIQSGGFQIVVIDASAGVPSDLSSYAAAAQQLGMKVMWETSDPGWWTGASVARDYPGFVQACGCKSNSSLLTYMIGFLGSLPGTYGYYAADDSMLSPGDQASVSRYISAINTIDPGHPAILSSGTDPSGYESVGDMNAAEIYPITDSALMPASRYGDYWQAIGGEVSGAQRAANRAGKPSAFILQAFSWGDNLDDGEAIGVCTPSMTQQQCWNSAVYPTPADQLKLRNEVLRHAHPKLILWWSFMGTYGQSGKETYSLYPTGSAAAAHWAGLSAAVQAPEPGNAQTYAGRKRAKKHHRHHHRHHHRRHHRRHRRRRHNA